MENSSAGGINEEPLRGSDGQSKILTDRDEHQNVHEVREASQHEGEQEISAGTGASGHKIQIGDFDPHGMGATFGAAYKEKQENRAGDGGDGRARDEDDGL